MKPIKRRSFFKTIAHAVRWLVLASPLALGIQSAFAKLKKVILPKGTSMAALISKNPKLLDTRNLEIIPLKDFGTMGVTDYMVDINQWRLEVIGRVDRPLSLKYAQLLALDPVEREVLMICPGIFANHGRWLGFSIYELLQMAAVQPDATHVKVKGPNNRYAKTMRFPISELESNQVFLAHSVNGSRLPVKHGFPVRTVAESYYGDDWIKYVYRVEAVKLES